MFLVARELPKSFLGFFLHHGLPKISPKRFPMQLVVESSLQTFFSTIGHEI
jgi:hypothetical protein